VEKQFDVLSIDLPEDYSVRLIKNTKDAKQWQIAGDKATIYVEDYLYGDTVDSNEYGFESSNSLSLYDSYLSVSPMEKKEYQVSYFTKGNYTGRLIIRKYIAGNSYLEVNFKGVCNKKCVFHITGDKLSENIRNELLKSVETIKFNCK
jgi:hypothetical protein